MENADERVEGIAGNSRELQGIAGNDGGNTKDAKDIPEIVRILAKKPEMRRELIKWVKSEFGFNIESYLEEWFDELPDKKLKIEDIDMPLREIAENVLQMTGDGYAPSQIAAYLGIYPSQVSRILKEKESWQKDISNALRKKTVQNKKAPFLLRLAARLKLI